jgi:hypothetical protein
MSLKKDPLNKINLNNLYDNAIIPALKEAEFDPRRIDITPADNS